MLEAQESVGGMQDNSPHRAVELRSAARTNLLLAATLHSADIGHPVKIRDLSATGARIETSLVTEVGTGVTLVRGRLSVDARVSWHAERFCGLSFTSPVSIQDWMTNPVILERRRGRPRVAIEGDVSDSAAAHSEVGKARAAEDLRRVSSLLGTLGEALASDPEVVLKHRIPLHNLGLAAQTLAALAKTMQADAPDPAARIGRRDQRRL